MERNVIRESADREFTILKGAVENTNEAFVTIDEHHQVIFFNHAAEAMFGYGREEIVGHDLSKILSPSCNAGHREAVEKYLATRKPKLIGHESEFMAVRKNGELFPAAISFSVAEIDGKLFFTALIRELTETKELRDQINRAERMAALGQVVAEIMHEIKNPLMLIGGFARQMRRTISDDKNKERLSIIVSEVERLEALALGLRDLYFPASMSFVSFDVNELLAEVHQLVQEECQKRGIHSVIRTEAGRRFIYGDRGKLKQVLINLTQNALEAMGESGELEIGSASSGSTIDVFISDSGPGIPEEIRDKIFSPFYTTKNKGSGLGLSVCKRIMDEHKQCSFEIVSEAGRGTIARLSFPLHQKP